MTLQVGDRFQQAWSGCTSPMFFVVLSIDRERNRLMVRCTSNDGFIHEEEWDDLDITEMSFDIGEYKLC